MLLIEQMSLGHGVKNSRIIIDFNTAIFVEIQEWIPKSSEFHTKYKERS